MNIGIHINPINEIPSSWLAILTILTGFTSLWLINNMFVEKHMKKTCFLPIPKEYQFLFPYIDKTSTLTYQTCLNKWNIGHIVIYLVTGLCIPNEYGFILLMSILCELYEYSVGFSSKLFDLFVNLFAYWVGNQFKINSFRKFGDKLQQNNKQTIYSIPVLFTLLFSLSYYT
jgi:hypothetical protein